jgi:4a-hydroxytetrahydrobiopterin dehydratase
MRKKCIPCEGGVSPLNRADAEALRTQTPEWSIAPDGKEISRTFLFENFVHAIAFINAVAKLAEAQGHHPDLNLHHFKKVTVTLSTHAIDGLSENDFILAAKIDALSEGIEGEYKWFARFSCMKSTVYL